MIRQITLWITLTFSCLILSSGICIAQKKKEEEKKFQKILTSIEAPSITSGSVNVDGTAIAYKAIEGTLPITASNELDTTARMSFAAYFKKDVKDVSNRPITFFYNGGPGSSTVWLHMGSFGPKRVVIDSTTHMHGAPYELVDNQYCLLNASDLVFIDAPATGFGRILKGYRSDYFGVDQDARAFAQFIRRFITKYNRWNSPKFLFGESYGTTRSAVLVNLLQGSYNIDMNGVILLSQILNFDFSVDGPSRNPGVDIPYQLALPTYAATAWYHHKLPKEHKNLEAFLKKVEDFAMGQYGLALSKGLKLDSATFNKVALQLHEFTGLSVEYINKANLRIDGGEFEQQLLGINEKATGRLDTRFSGPILNPLAQRSYYDPQSSAISGAYIALFNHYVRHTLKYGDKMYYRPNAYGYAPWNWRHNGRSTGVNVMPDLARAMKKNPELRVMFNGGYYDLATPFYEGIYELNHLAIPRSLTKNIQTFLYPSGHMIYLHVPSLQLLHKNVTQFIENNYSEIH